MATNLPDPTPDNPVAKDKAERETRSGVFARLMLFIRQVIDELRKVVTPTRSELVNYTLVVLVFVLIMMGIIVAFDLLFGWAISWVFGDGSSLF
ncbi:MAG: preprotein translocase subunit SecE [Microbacteriaceae bacterium]|nr:preprotein translocase subunit SecE [Microbacteriaceae bacterium]